MGHDRADVTVAEGEDALDDVLLHVLHLAAVEAFLHDGPNLLLGHLILARAVEPEQEDHALRTLRKHPHDRRGHLGEDVHRPSHKFGHLLSEIHPDTLRRKLTEHKREVGDNDNDRQLGYPDRIRLKPRHTGEHTGQISGESLAREKTREDADERNADLGGGEELIGLLGQVEGLLR